MRRWPYKLSLVGLKLQTRRTSPCFISSNSRELALQTLEQHETFSNLSFASKKVQALEEIALQCWDTHTPWAISHFPQLPGFFLSPTAEAAHLSNYGLQIDRLRPWYIKLTRSLTSREATGDSPHVAVLWKQHWRPVVDSEIQVNWARPETQFI